MRHPITIKSGTWQGREGVYIEGAVIISGTEKLYLSDIMTVENLAAGANELTISIKATKWFITIVASVRVYQLLKSYSSVSYKQSAKNTLIATEAKVMGLGCRTCGGGS